LLWVLDGERVAIRSRGSTDVIGWGEIVLARSVRNSTCIVTCNGEIKVRHTLGFVVDRLAHLGLVRVHRNTAVNRTKVRRLKGFGRHRLHVDLDGGFTLEVGRTFQRVLRESFNAASALN
jgi:DNA-binding LytR/AlgR family response regulator